MRHGSLFSGIGGFDLAAQWMGWENIFHCEWMPFPRKILNYYWPNAISYEDIRKTDFTIHRGGIDILTGGFPCQPYSLAGQRKGKEDERHLWPEMLRAIREIQPRWIVGENVRGIISWSDGMVFEEVCADLENVGYEVMPFILPACGVNAPHRRDRVWFVAKNTDSNGCVQRKIKQERTEIWQQRNISPRDFNGFHRKSNEGITPYTTSNGYTNGCEEAGGEERSSKQGRMQQFEGMGIQQNASDTESKRTRKQSSKNSGWKDGRFDNIGKKGNASDTCDKGLQGCQDNRIIGSSREESYQQSSRFICTDWENFPTQSPICGGNDGVSYGLDNITFSKWRNESIKGYGNAIVPQVVFEIFKTIEQYENI